jgi:hypothetical protein
MGLVVTKVLGVEEGVRAWLWCAAFGGMVGSYVVGGTARAWDRDAEMNRAAAEERAAVLRDVEGWAAWERMRETWQAGEGRGLADIGECVKYAKKKGEVRDWIRQGMQGCRWM